MKSMPVVGTRLQSENRPFKWDYVVFERPRPSSYKWKVEGNNNNNNKQHSD